MSVMVNTFDRYWRIVHPIHHRKHYRRWMLYVGLSLPWLNGIVVRLLPSVCTTRIVNGLCRPSSFWAHDIMNEVRSSRFE